LTSRHNLNELIEKEIEPRSLIKVNRVMKGLLAGLIAIGFIEFFVILNSLS
jgi:hypothetical protein